MNRRTLALLLAAVVSFSGIAADPETPPRTPPPARQAVLPPNPNIDMAAYIKSVERVAKHRESRRLTEDQFIEMSKQEGVVVLDARSQDKYDLLHVKGAINLNFSDITVESLQKVLPDKDARILIYCNNNFKNAAGPFPSKAPIASLNISTYITLYNYGYRNVYELGPQLDPARSKIAFVSTTKRRR